MSFQVAHVRLADGDDGTLHRRRNYGGVDPEVELDCGRRAAPYDLILVDPIHWKRGAACAGCWNHLLFVVDDDGTPWKEAPTSDGEPSNLFYIAPRPDEPDEVPEELTPLAEILREFGLREVT